MKSLQIYINEYIIKKKLDKPIDSEHIYKYIPNTKEELVEILRVQIEDLCEGCISLSNAEGFGERSFHFSYIIGI